MVSPLFVMPVRVVCGSNMQCPKAGVRPYPVVAVRGRFRGGQLICATQDYAPKPADTAQGASPREITTKWSRKLLQGSLSLPCRSRQAWEQGLAVTTPAATWAAWTVLAAVPTAAAHSHTPPFGVRHRRRRRHSAVLPARASRKATRHQRGFAAAGQACATAPSAAMSERCITISNDTVSQQRHTHAFSRAPGIDELSVPAHSLW